MPEIIKTTTRKISELKKEVNRLNEQGKKDFIIETDLILGGLANNSSTKHRIFLNQLVSMTTGMEELKKMNFQIVLSYGKMYLTQEKKEKVKRIVEQLLHQLEFTKVTLKINTTQEKGEIFRNSKFINIIEDNNVYLTVGPINEL